MNLNDLFSSGVPGIIMLAIISTFGIYFVSSFLYLDAWHMFTSFLQYILAMTSYINVMMVYALCNWHDVTCGTKESGWAEYLPSAQLKRTDEQELVVEEVDKPQADIDSEFEKTMTRALSTPKADMKKETDCEDFSKSFRTWLVSTWIFANAIVALAVTFECWDGISLKVSSPFGR